MTIHDHQLPFLQRLPEELKAHIIRHARLQHVKAGTEVFGPGNPAENLYLLVSGTLRVQKLAETGREMVLYRVHAGESCILTTACLLAHEDYAASGLAETDLDVVVIPQAVFDDLVSTSDAFRNLIFKAYSHRITDLLTVIEEVAFRRVDLRLAAKLLEMADQSDDVNATHQDLAIELGTAREVISRQLQEFQRRGWLSLGRGTLTLIDRAALDRFAHSSDHAAA
ncbi:Crp/Fnr family transcriptional regulator [Ahrensia marina]|uniref:Crp/Fnr family transcriptional regulator n=1 Tax=Ahrensia marina TaxID=1514904 RepID=UPI0035CF46A1